MIASQYINHKFGFENGKLSLIKDTSLPKIGPLPALVFVTNSHSWQYIFSTTCLAKVGHHAQK
jgi:hypothetical protein